MRKGLRHALEWIKLIAFVVVILFALGIFIVGGHLIEEWFQRTAYGFIMGVF